MLSCSYGEASKYPRSKRNDQSLFIDDICTLKHINLLHKLDPSFNDWRKQMKPNNPKNNVDLQL